MDDLTNLNVNSVLDGLDLPASSSTWEKYIKKIENLYLKWNNLHITLTAKRSLGDYFRSFLFFVLRCVIVVLFLWYLLPMFGSSFADSFYDIQNNIKNNIHNSLDLNRNSDPIFEQTKAVKDYVWMMDELNWK